jgi:hypothetical protein
MNKKFFLEKIKDNSNFLYSDGYQHIELGDSIIQFQNNTENDNVSDIELKTENVDNY